MTDAAAAPPQRRDTGSGLPRPAGAYGAAGIAAAAPDPGRLAAAPDAPGPGKARHQGAFRVVFALLTIEFAGLGISYLAGPGSAVRAFSRWNQILGGIKLVSPDVPPWRYVTAIGMVTVALMCAMLLADLRRNWPVLTPAAFFKAFNAVLWFWFAARHGHGHLPVFYAAGVFDCLQVLVMIAVARRAYRALPGRDLSP
jgi:hypothetical protein